MSMIDKDLNEFVAQYRRRHNGVRFYGYDEAKESMVEATETKPLVGVDMDNTPVYVDLHNDSPHILISMGSGGGKSVVLKTLLAQFARNGAKPVILDYKRHSHRWATRVPEITYCRDIEEIHYTLVALAEEGMHRYKSADNLSDEDFDRGEWMGDRIVVAVEEMNALMAELEDFWMEERSRVTGSGQFWKVPRRSPAVKALHKLLAMGRAANINVLAVAQRASVASMGGGGGYGAGGDARENFAVRILARYTRLAWKMLIPECDYIPASEHIGRAQVAIAGKATETQMLYLTDDEAVEFATGKEAVTGDTS